jgi:predicted adenine nucleotide alpha hydrolase (AANH) superfamily ATPase
MLNRESKDFYNQEFKELIKEVDALKEKPTLFLHACCGPCLTYPLSILLDHFKVTVGFFNPNIQPLEEYQKRLKTLQDFIKAYSQFRKEDIPLIINEDDFEKYNRLFAERIHDQEGGKTCLRCHAYRMGLAYEYANDHHFDYFTTVMTVSCKKPSKELNEIAEKLALKYPNTKYLYSDFKKENGQYKGILIAKEYQLYRQDYCGCLVSLKEREEYKKKKALEMNLKA